MPGTRVFRRRWLVVGVSSLLATAGARAADLSERPDHSSIQPFVLRILRSTQPAGAPNSGSQNGENLVEKQRADILAAATIAHDDVAAVRDMRRGLKDFGSAERE